MRVLFRLQARIEALEAQAWYESRAAGLGLEFARSIDAAVASAVRNPEAYPSLQVIAGASCSAGFRSHWSIAFVVMSCWS